METVIHVHNLSKSYNSNKILDKINIQVQKGEIFGLLGANGAGKSTTIECILGTKTKDAGSVSILDLNPLKNRKLLFEKVGVQFQEANYQENIHVDELCMETQALYKNPADYQYLLELFGLTDKKQHLVKELSGGQKQKLFIILTLLPQPQIVFLDELTTGLDTKARREVWDILIELKKSGLTIFLTSHFMDEVELLCDRIAILKDGHFIYEGTVNNAIVQSPHNKLEDAYLWYVEEEKINESI